ncbi:hypothetical protein AC249_AIPGENE18259, partial [Exaiptasia diaphana]
MGWEAFGDLLQVVCSVQILKDFIGEAECTLGSIVGENGGKLEKSLQNKQFNKSRGKIIVTCEEVSDCK